MAFVPALNTAKVVLEYTWSSQAVVQTFWMQYSASPSAADLQTIADHFRNNFNASMVTSQATSISLVRVTATRQDNANDIQAVSTPASPVPGTGSGDSVPLNAAWVFSYRTALRGRSYRGRGYQPGLLNSILTSPGIGNSAILTAIAANYVQWLITSVPAGWTWVVASHFHNKAPRASAVLTPIISVVVDTLLDSQRRRLVGRGS